MKDFAKDEKTQGWEKMLVKHLSHGQLVFRIYDDISEHRGGEEPRATRPGRYGHKR